MQRQSGLALGLVVMLIACSGASCPGFLHSYSPPMARVLPQTATLNDVMKVVNDNSAKVQSLYTTSASIYTPGAPTLSANLAIDRPRKFRLRAETTLTGPEVDLGSNDELFWFWIKRSVPPTLYYCGHDRFSASAAKQIIPVEPEWLIDALGLATIDPGGNHSGPHPVGRGRLRIETQLPANHMTRVLIVDEARGWILEQHLLDARRQIVATAAASNHMRDALTGAILPQQVKIDWPATQFQMTIELRNLVVNHIDGDPQQLWTLPTYSETRAVDLGDPNFRPPVAPTAALPPSYPERKPPDRVGRAAGTSWMDRFHLRR